MDELDIIALQIEIEFRKKVDACTEGTIEERIAELISKITQNPEAQEQLKDLIARIREPNTEHYIASKDVAYRGNLKIDWDRQQRHIASIFGRQPQEGEVYILIEKEVFTPKKIKKEEKAKVICYGLTHYINGQPNPHVFVFTGPLKYINELTLLRTQKGLNDLVKTAYKWENLLGAEKGEVILFQEVKKIYVKNGDKIQEITCASS